MPPGWPPRTSVRWPRRIRPLPPTRRGPRRTCCTWLPPRSAAGYCARQPTPTTGPPAPPTAVSRPPARPGAGCGHRMAGSRQLRRLGLLPAGQREHRRVILRPRNRSCFRIRRNPPQHLDDMPLPPQRLLDHLSGQVVKPRNPRHRRAGAGIQHGEVLRRQQPGHADHDHLASGVSQADRRPGDPDHRLVPPAEPDPVPDAELTRPPRPGHKMPPGTAPERTTDSAVSLTARSAVST